MESRVAIDLADHRFLPLWSFETHHFLAVAFGMDFMTRPFPCARAQAALRCFAETGNQPSLAALRPRKKLLRAPL